MIADNESQDGQQQQEEAGNDEAKRGTFEQFYNILSKPADKRTTRDCQQIDVRIKSLTDPFVLALDEKMRSAIGRRLVLEEFADGDVIFDYGDIGDRMYIIWEGRVQVEVPKTALISGPATDKPELAKAAVLNPGKVFGELALMADSNLRKARCTAIKRAKLLALSADDYKWCVGASRNHNYLHDRVQFLETVERNLLEDVSQVDLQVMAGCLLERFVTSGERIIEQGQEVEHIVFVKGGFCKVIRQIHPKYNEQCQTYAVKRKPVQNPFAPEEARDADGGGYLKELLAGLSGQTAVRKLLVSQNSPRSSENTFMSTPRSTQEDRRSSTPRSPRRESAFQLPPLSARKSRSIALQGAEGAAAESGNEKERKQASSAASHVLVGELSAGQTFGVMEMLEGLPYQCSVVADGWAELYAITKYDLLRRTSRAILHRLFSHYKPRVVDERLVQRMRQLQRWTNYKRELLDDIGRRKVPKSINSGVIDRFAAPSRRVGVQGLDQKDYVRIGNGETVWDKRAQTPPMTQITTTEGSSTFNVYAVRGADGILDIKVETQYRDAEAVALDDKVRDAMINGRRKDRQRRARAVSDMEALGSPASHHGALAAEQDADGKSVPRRSAVFSSQRPSKPSSMS